MSETSIKTGKVDLEKLLKRTKHHPKGRVQIDEETGEVKNPKNPITGVTTMAVIEDGKVVSKEIPVYRGNVKAEGSVWRAGMRWKGKVGAEAYHQMCLDYDERAAMGKERDDFRPELSKEEMVDYLEWKKINNSLSEDEEKKLETLKK